MICKICNNPNSKVIYNGRIRKGGGFNCFTAENILMFQCEACGTIWHENLSKGIKAYYESEEYRNDMMETATIECYQKNHDKEVLEKLQYTGTEIYRDKIVADVGCGGGSFIDFLYGVANKTIGIDPTEHYRIDMQRKGHITFPYIFEAVKEYQNCVDVVTSFDVIEHVDDPFTFLSEISKLCNRNGRIIIGTPSEQPIMRKALGQEYDSFLFSYQHLWIFNEKSLVLLAKKAGFKNIRIEYKQRYGLGNLVAWLKEHKPMGNLDLDYISPLTNELWKKDIEQNQLADYLILYANM